MNEPPFSLESEVSVLGALLIDSKAMPAALELVRAADFYRDTHRRLFSGFVEMWERGEPIDPVAVASHLKARGDFDQAGGFDYLASLVDAVPSSANIAYHARIVREKSAMRRILDAATGVIQEVQSSGDIGAVSAMIDKLAGSVDGLATSDFVWLKETLWDTFEWIERMQESGGGVTGIPSGFRDLDRMTCGFQPGDLIVLAARPSMGKTGFATDCVRNAAVGHAVPTAVVSLEMSVKQLNLRMLCQEGRVDMQRLRQGKLSPEEHQRIAAAAGHMNTAPIYVDDQSDGGLAGVVAKIQRLRQTKGLGLAVVDYLQLMSAPGESRRHEIDAITKAFKRLAVKLEIPVVLLSQLSRAPDARTDHRPMLSDLRESGGIEQDADVVMFLYRPEYYAKPGEAGELEGKAELIVAKQRNGPTGMVPLYFQKAYTRFDSVDRTWRDEYASRGRMDMGNDAH